MGKTIAVIPARYGSTRYPGKPLADIHGKPMIWWVYNQVKKASKIDAIYVAIDDERVAEMCKKYHINFKMTSSNHKTSTERVNEIASLVEATVYVCINGDEPLIDPKVIDAIVPGSLEGFFAANLMTEITNPVEVIDNTNIKVVTDGFSNAIFMSRSPIPYPRSNMNFRYYKHIGVLAYTKEALNFFTSTPRGKNEIAEDINELRFMEYGRNLKMIVVNTEVLSVDTPKDLEYVREKIKHATRGEI